MDKPVVVFLGGAAKSFGAFRVLQMSSSAVLHAVQHFNMFDYEIELSAFQP